MAIKYKKTFLSDFMINYKYLFIFVVALTACGGGGGSSSSDSQPNAAPELIGLTDYAIDENTSIVTTIEATDADGDTITYSITGVDSSFLAIDSSSGLLTFQSPPDYENPQDDNQDNIYNITVTASDGQLSASLGIIVSVVFSGPTLDKPFHMPTMTDTSTLDVVVIEDWHVDNVNGTTRQKLITIHVDDWWMGVEIRVPVRLIAPLEGSVNGFVITGAALPDTGDMQLLPGEQVAIDGGVGVVKTKIKAINQYPGLPTTSTLRNRFLEDLDWRYTEYYLWSAIMMRSITAAFDNDVFRAGPVIAYGGSKNGITPLISSIHDERITAVRSNVAFTAFSPVRANDMAAVAAVAAADSDFDSARAAGLAQGDQPWNYYNKGYRSFAAVLDLARASGWSEADIQTSIDRVADDLYVSENWDQLAARGVDYFSLPGSHDWVAYDVPGTSTILPDLRTYILPNGGHDRPGHPEAPGDSVNAAFFAEQLFGADGGLETPDIATTVNGATLDVTVTFPDGGVPEDSRIFWMYDRRPDGSSWYLYDLLPEPNWTTMVGSGSSWTGVISLEPGRTSIDLITTHTVTVGANTIPISAPYTRVALD
jgi:hypothetical protein